MSTGAPGTKLIRDLSVRNTLTSSHSKNVRRSLSIKDAGRVIGFVGYGDRGEEAPDIGEIFALYILSEYYGKGVGQQLMKAALQQMRGYQQICLWVLKENKRAIRFYQKCGFDSDGEEIYSTTVAASEIRMILKR